MTTSEANATHVTLATLQRTLIAPREGNKYSVNLFQFLDMRKHASLLARSHVYQDANGGLWLGYLDNGELTGVQMQVILREGVRTQLFTFVNTGEMALVPDFWEQYIADGRCVFDREHKQHFIGDDMRWDVQGDSRACLWCCKAIQTRHRWVEHVQREAWRPATLTSK